MSSGGSEDQIPEMQQREHPAGLRGCAFTGKCDAGVRQRSNPDVYFHISGSQRFILERHCGDGSIWWTMPEDRSRERCSSTAAPEV
jgi:hypothetical protein